MIKKLSITAAVIALFCTSAANAATVQWNLNDVTGGGETATGFFDYSTTTNSVTDWNISVTGTSTAHFFLGDGDANGTSFFGTGFQNPTTGQELVFELQTSALSGSGVIPLSVGSFFADLSSNFSTAITGTLVSGVPIPASLPLFGLAIAGLVWQRKRSTARPDGYVTQAIAA